MGFLGAVPEILRIGCPKARITIAGKKKPRSGDAQTGRAARFLASGWMFAHAVRGIDRGVDVRRVVTRVDLLESVERHAVEPGMCQ